MKRYGRTIYAEVEIEIDEVLENISDDDLMKEVESRGLLNRSIGDEIVCAIDHGDIDLSKLIKKIGKERINSFL